jgi:hypothetical protein
LICINVRATDHGALLTWRAAMPTLGLQIRFSLIG